VGAIQARNLERNVKYHGYTPAHRLDNVLHEADLVINLRGPTVGECSGSQLRAWDHALPTLVSRTGWYATIPESATSFVSVYSDPKSEIKDIHRHLDAFLQEPEMFALRGQAGRTLLLERHSQSSYINGLLALCRRLPELSVQWAENYLADRMGAIARASLVEPALLDRTAERIVDLFRGYYPSQT
jgi:hypothetical protein